MTEKYTISNVSEDLSFLLSLTKLFEADDEGFWVDSGHKERFVHKLDANDDGKLIVNFQDPMPKGDYYYFNPFAEGFGRKSPATTLFYKTVRVAFNVNLRMATMFVAQEIVDSKADTTKALDHAVIRMGSVPVDKKSTVYDIIDEKMIDEFDKLFNRMEGSDQNGCIYVPYLHQQMTAKVKCGVFDDPTWDEKFGKDIRKKTIATFTALLLGVLGIKEAEELNQFSVKYDPDLKSSARLHTTLTVYLKLYSKFNEVLPELDTIDLGLLQDTIERMPLAYAIAKHMIQPVMPKNSPTDTSTVDTSRLSLGGVNGGSRFAGPEVIDSLGRKTRQNQPLTFGGAGEQRSRFQRHVISEIPADPFAPLTSTNPPINSGFGSPSMSFGGNQGGGYFGGQSSYNPGSFNTSPPSNFNTPQTRRNYF